MADIAAKTAKEQLERNDLVNQIWAISRKKIKKCGDSKTRSSLLTLLKLQIRAQKPSYDHIHDSDGQESGVDSHEPSSTSSAFLRAHALLTKVLEAEKDSQLFMYQGDRTFALLHAHLKLNGAIERAVDDARALPDDLWGMFVDMHYDNFVRLAEELGPAVSRFLRKCEMVIAAPEA